jgi:sodium-dependent dicarboxylate transporter 2/3/5
MEIRPANANLWLLGAVAIAGTVVLLLLWFPVLPREGALMAGIFVLAALLWMTEALPLFATSLLVIGLQILLLANPGAWPGLGFEAGSSPSYQEVLAAAADPVLALFFGGLVLARAAIKERVNEALAGLLLHPLGDRPLFILLALMLLTAVFSMWMSNTATAAMMIALGVSITAQLPAEEPFRKGLLLSVPFAANIGGLGTPVASPPNAIAVGFLERANHPVGFLEWMVVAVPLMLVLILFTWLLLWWCYRPSCPALRLQTGSQPLTRRGWYVVGVMVVTISLWMSERWHGLPAAAVALIPAVALTATGLLKRDDVNNLDWSVLILIAGGISLGAGMQWTGLAQEVASWLPSPGYANGLWLLAALVTVTLVLSTFMSNTAAANLLLPLGIAAATAEGGEKTSVVQIAMSIALTASVSMALPISTPPNSIAYSQGVATKSDMMRVGVVVGVVAAALIIGLSNPVLRFWGLYDK